MSGLQIRTGKRRGLRECPPTPARREGTRFQSPCRLSSINLARSRHVRRIFLHCTATNEGNFARVPVGVNWTEPKIFSGQYGSWRMIKNIRVSVDQKSWTSPPPKYRKAFPFASLPPSSGIDFRRAMLWTGLMSVSPRMPQWWTASQWATLRYFGAVDGTVAALRLHSAVDEIDTHPKKVLSDDWGIGIGLEWLDSQFQYAYVQHGRRVIDELQALGIANFAGKKKSGPQKCPDFICTDRNGRYHIIECKGNQQGPDHTAVQFKQIGRASCRERV